MESDSPSDSPSDELGQPRDMPAAPECWYLTGPTASGKTLIGLELAKRLDAEILSLDSMAIYQGMDIGTAKPSAAQRALVPHHLIDIVAPTEDFSLSQYLQAAHQKIAELQQRGKQVLLVGGTPLYLKAMLRGLYHGPPADWEFRRQVEAELQEVGIDALHQRLGIVDPLLADKLHPHDKRRIIRALEVHRLTGQPLSHLQREFEEGRSAEDCRVFVLQRERAELHERIQQRVAQMFERGLLEEIRGLLAKYGSLGRTARQAVGYREGIEMLQQSGDLSDTVAQVAARTRQFARRQETWFRSLSECRFVPLSGEPDSQALAEQIFLSGSGCRD